MQVGMDWLQEWVELDADADRVAEKLTMIGLEVESMSPPGPDFTGVSVAVITRVRTHPDAVRLRVCEVDTGTGIVQVVSGAENVAVGQHVALAAAGARLPGGRLIEATEIRGTASAGMLCSAAELGLGDDNTGILVLDGCSTLGASIRAELRLDSPVLDVNITPNRADCFSVLGLAREIAVATARPMRSAAMEPVATHSSTTFDVMVETTLACPRFGGRVIEGIVSDAITPLWIRERLRRAGIRSIHPVVDVTNYVMLELGQPLHGYDLRKLKGGLAVRFAQPGECVRLLDGKQLTLSGDVLVIGDGSGALGLAGIMGGASTTVDGTTVDVFLESAYFAPEYIAGRARRFGLHTDASARFERGVDPAQQSRALERATELLLEIAGGRAGPIRLEEAPDQIPTRATIPFRRARLGALLGYSPQPEVVTDLLQRLEMEVQASTTGWTVTPPSFRFDVSIEEDLVEEVGRLLGYDAIPADPGRDALELGLASESRVSEETLADTLVARGYSEIINYGFGAEEHAHWINPGAELARLQNPISRDLAVLRRSLWPGLLSTAQRNQNRQQTRLRIFEIGQQFRPEGAAVSQMAVLAGLACGSNLPEQWGEPLRPVDFFDVKADVEALLGLTGRASEYRFVAASHPALRPGQTARIELAGNAVGWLGGLHPRLQQLFDLKAPAVLFCLQVEPAFNAMPTHFEPYSRFPWLRRDLALLVAEDLAADRLLAEVRSAAGSVLQNAFVFDVYRGTGIDSRRKSVALGLILQGASRTLTDEEADRTVDTVTRRLEQVFGVTIRT